MLVSSDGDFPDAEDSAVCCRDALIEKLGYRILLHVSSGSFTAEDASGGRNRDLKLDLKQFQNSPALSQKQY